MSERPILFSAEMVRAILAGRKTQTRRVIKPQPWVDNMGNACWKDRNFGQSANHVPHIKALASPIPCSDTKRVLCPYGKPGDLLWVRETWGRTTNVNDSPLWPGRAHIPMDGGEVVIFAADGHWQWCDGDGFATERSMWRPSIHMPRWASRITLRITDVRVERLQDISRQDCEAEGCAGGHDSIPGYNYSATSREHFFDVWNRINGPGAWEANPWVWAISFERVTP